MITATRFPDGPVIRHRSERADRGKTRSPVPRYPALLMLFILSILLYANTLTHDYALDDSLVITKNVFTKKGLEGLPEIFTLDSFTGFFGKHQTLVAGGRYRPLSIATFAMEYSLFGGPNPSISHLINMLLYTLTGFLVYLVLMRLFPPPHGTPWYRSVPFWTSILFLAMPLHTEVVANIKGRDEIMAMLFSLWALHAALVWVKKPKQGSLILSAAALFLALLSKENAILFLVLIPLTVWAFIPCESRRLAALTGSLLGSVILFLAIRSAVLGYLFGSEQPPELLNDPFLNVSAGERFGTILVTLGRYLKLLLIPWPLTHDYYPWQVPLTGLASPAAIIPLLLYLALIVLAFAGVRRKTLWGFGIAHYLITLFLVSNLVFPVGTLMNERFLFMPSLGFLLIVSWLVAGSLPARTGMKSDLVRDTLSLTILLLVLAGYSVLTIARNRAWKDDYTLFTTDVKVSVNSTKCNTAAAGATLERAMAVTDPLARDSLFRQAEAWLTRALEIHPENRNALLLLGNAMVQHRDDPREGMEYYLRVLTLDPRNTVAMDNSLKVLNSMDNTRYGVWKLGAARRLHRLRPDYGPVCRLMGSLLGRVAGDLDSARVLLTAAVRLMPEDAAALKDLGTVLCMQQDYANALGILERALVVDPNDRVLRQNIELTRRALAK